MASMLIKGAAGKFAESFGSGLAYGIVAVLAIIVLKYWFLQDEAIVTFTQFYTACLRDAHGNNCIVKADCKANEIAIGGECTVQNSERSVHLQNFGLGLVEGDKENPRRFECNWSGEGANPSPMQKIMEPRVRAVCISKTRFGVQIPQLGK